MSIRAAGTAFLRQERQRLVEAIATIDAALATVGASRRRPRTAKGNRSGPRPAAAKQRRKRVAKRPVARAANLAAAATGN